MSAQCKFNINGENMVQNITNHKGRLIQTPFERYGHMDSLVDTASAIIHDNVDKITDSRELYNMIPYIKKVYIPVYGSGAASNFDHENADLTCQGVKFHQIKILSVSEKGIVYCGDHRGYYGVYCLSFSTQCDNNAHNTAKCGITHDIDCDGDWVLMGNILYPRNRIN